MRVLVVSPYFSPSPAVGAKRFSFLARELESRGHDVDVLTLSLPTQGTPDKTLPQAGSVRAVRGVLPIEVDVQGVIPSAYDWFTRKVLGYPDRFVLWLPAIVAAGRAVASQNRPDVIVATGPPFTAFLAGALLSRTVRAPLVLDYRDPWTAFRWSETKTGRRMRSRVRKLMERWCLQSAAAAVFASEPMRTSFAELAGDRLPSRRAVITNGYDPLAEITSAELTPGAINVVYAGSFYGERRLSGLAGAAALLRSRGHGDAARLVFHVFGSVPAQERETLSRILAPRQLHEYAPVPHAQVLRYMAAADILFLPSGGDVSYALPYKIFDYLSVSRPILGVTPCSSAVAALMAQVDCGEVATEDEPAAIAVALERILERRGAYTFSGREQFTWDRVARRYEQLLLDVVGG